MAKARKIAATLVLALTIMGCRSGGGKIANLEPHPGPIVVLGDSLSAGVGAPQHGFVDVLQQRCGQPLVNRGVPGDTTGSALARLKSDVLDLKPALVLVELGGNDYLQRVDPQETFANLDKIVGAIQDQGGAVLILALQGGILTHSYQSEFSELAENRHTGLVPNILERVFGHTDLMSDSIHPNDQGYLKVADNIEPDLRRCLEGLKRL